MAETCFNCEAPASKRCRIELSRAPDLEDKPICRACYTFFDRSVTIDITDTTRGQATK